MITPSLRKAIEASAAKRRERQIEKTCPVCRAVFSVRPSMMRQECCSQSCARLRSWGRPDYRANMIRAAQGRPSPMQGKKHARNTILKMRNAHAIKPWMERAGEKHLHLFKEQAPTFEDFFKIFLKKKRESGEWSLDPKEPK